MSEVTTEKIELEYFDKIMDIPFVRKSFDDLIYNKLLFNGYVYCKEGLVPSNKSVFKPLELIQSPF